MSRRVAIFAYLLLGLLVGCTVIAFNKGNVETVDKDSHDAHGTNRAHTFDVNISPR